jgi:hypothetical protein
LEGSGINRIPINIFNETSQVINPQFEAIEKILSYLINPENIQYKEEELIKKFNYPDVDLDKID